MKKKMELAWTHERSNDSVPKQALGLYADRAAFIGRGGDCPPPPIKSRKQLVGLIISDGCNNVILMTKTGYFVVQELG